MTSAHRFGGPWTQDKLERIRKYLEAYRRIFVANAWARRYATVYVDAFAGTGERSDSKEEQNQTPSLFDDEDTERVEVLRGSVKVALELPSPFDHYLFIDKNRRHIANLRDMHTQLNIENPDLAARVEIEPGDANEVLTNWCARTDWARTRAVVFLDPYGMQVRWRTLERLASTKAVDLWLLFPLGQAINRMLIRNEEPPQAWAAALDEFFGTPTWRDAFYREQPDLTLFGNESRSVRKADLDGIGQFFVKRLDSIFAEVSKNPLALSNSRGTPLYLLLFAAANVRGAKTAIKIADHILR